MKPVTRRSLLKTSAPAAGLGIAALGGAFNPAKALADSGAGPHAGHAGHGTQGHASFTGGEVDHAGNGFNPHTMLRDFDWGKTHRTAAGRTVREWTLVAQPREIEVAPGVKYPAWTYNGRVPGPTIRAREGERLRVRLVNSSEHNHTIHFHGIHPAAMDGVAGQGAGEIGPGKSTVYEFDANPFGLHLYHCHVRPLAEHIVKGLYGAFIIDPKEGRREADEMVLVLNGFDTNFDRANEVYAANTVGFAYMNDPIRVHRNDLVRMYIVNVLEYDLINSFHLHGNLFNYYPTGTSLKPSEYTDTVMQCQGQRGIAEVCFPDPGRFMIHAHQSEFTELGWQGFIEVGDGAGPRGYCEL